MPAVPTSSSGATAARSGDDPPAGGVDPAARRTPRWRRLVRTVFVVGAVLVALVALWTRRGDVLSALTRIGVGATVGALALTAVGTVLTMLCWRALLADVGSRLGVRTAARVFFPAQLGKYVPGSVWTLVAQVELGRAAAVPPRRSAAVGVLTLLVSVAVGSAVVLACLPVLGSGVTGPLRWAGLLLPVVLVGLHPAVVRRVLGLALRVTRRPGDVPEVTARGLATASGWQLAAWLVLGLHVALLAGPLGGWSVRLVVLSVGGFALAWLAGFLAVVAPAGAGVRDVVLVLVLAPVLDPAEALLVALLSRALLTVVDLGLAGLAVLGRGRGREPT